MIALASMMDLASDCQLAVEAPEPCPLCALALENCRCRGEPCSSPHSEEEHMTRWFVQLGCGTRFEGDDPQVVETAARECVRRRRCENGEDGSGGHPRSTCEVGAVTNISR